MNRISYIIKKSLQKHNIYDFYLLEIIREQYVDETVLNSLRESVRKEIQYELYYNDMVMIFAERIVRVINTVPNWVHSEEEWLTGIDKRDLNNPVVLVKVIDKLVSGNTLDNVQDDTAFSQPWRNTWKAFKKCIKSYNWNSFVQAFDHFVDQVHNSGSILEKFPKGIQDAVELKKWGNPKDLYPHASNDVKKLYLQQRRYLKEDKIKNKFLFIRAVKDGDLKTVSEYFPEALNWGDEVFEGIAQGGNIGTLHYWLKSGGNLFSVSNIDKTNINEIFQRAIKIEDKYIIKEILKNKYLLKQTKYEVFVSLYALILNTEDEELMNLVNEKLNTHIFIIKDELFKSFLQMIARGNLDFIKKVIEAYKPDLSYMRITGVESVELVNYLYENGLPFNLFHIQYALEKENFELAKDIMNNSEISEKDLERIEESFIKNEKVLNFLDNYK